MELEGFPATDNHMHINPVRGSGPLQVGKEFKKAGGTALIVVCLPSWSYGVTVSKPSDYEKCYSYVLECVEKLRSLDLYAYGVVGVHPAELTQMMNRGISLKRAEEIMYAALDLAVKWVEEGKAIAIGEVGRPHYPVNREIWDASNEILLYALGLAKDCGCPVQLHTESMGEKEIVELSGLIRSANLDPSRVIKHFSPPLVRVCERVKIFPSIIASKRNVETALREGDRFLLETDYLDDPHRPGAVLGPKSVPRRVNMLKEREDLKERLWKVNKENPEKIYGVQFF
ncbi:MAG: TatD family hydrolase [Candidatus Freyarchaeota archaeon]|nr:TatD family hydrolase [Candidatus Freyarchaeota archaeon]